MGKYVTKRCNKCNEYIAHFQPTSGTKFCSPFVKCSNCGEVQIDRECKEYIMLNAVDYFRLFAGVGGIGLIIGIIIDFCFASLTNSGTVQQIFTWVCGILAIYLYYSKKFTNDKEASIKRLRDKKYLKQLLDNKLITKKQFDNFNQKYN